MRRRLQGLLDYADNLPSLPVAVIRALQLLNNEDSTTDAIVIALSADQALAAQLLKIANSPYYGVSRRVSTIKQAALVLGRKAVKSLVIAAAAEDYLSRPQDGYLLDRGQLWQHSLVVAQASAMVAGRVQYRQSEEAFVAGLLHDIGKVVLNSYLQACRDKVAARLNAPGAGSFTDIETELLSANHASIGGVVAVHWQLPERLARAIEFQHAPSEAGDYWDLACIVHIANALTLSLGIGLGLDGLHYYFDQAAVTRLGLGEDDLMELADTLIETIHQAASPKL